MKDLDQNHLKKFTKPVFTVTILYHILQQFVFSHLHLRASVQLVWIYFHTDTVDIVVSAATLIFISVMCTEHN